MKKKYRIILYTSIFLLCVVASIILVVKKSNSVYEEESKPKVVKLVNEFRTNSRSRRL